MKSAFTAWPRCCRSPVPSCHDPTARHPCHLCQAPTSDAPATATLRLSILQSRLRDHSRTCTTNSTPIRTTDRQSTEGLRSAPCTSTPDTRQFQHSPWARLLRRGPRDRPPSRTCQRCTTSLSTGLLLSTVAERDIRRETRSATTRASTRTSAPTERPSICSNRCR